MRAADYISHKIFVNFLKYVKLGLPREEGMAAHSMSCLENPHRTEKARAGMWSQMVGHD